VCACDVYVCVECAGYNVLCTYTAHSLASIVLMMYSPVPEVKWIINSALTHYITLYLVPSIPANPTSSSHLYLQLLTSSQSQLQPISPSAIFTSSPSYLPRYFQPLPPPATPTTYLQPLLPTQVLPATLTSSHSHHTSSHSYLGTSHLQPLPPLTSSHSHHTSSHSYLGISHLQPLPPLTSSPPT